MTAIQYLSAFRLYSADVLILALGVTLVTSLLKKTVLRKLPKKYYVFLPFAVGIAFYATYRAILSASAAPFTTELSKTVEGGFGCGCAATLYYVVYEQFFRVQKPLPAVGELLKGLVPEDKRAAAATALTEGRKGKSQEELLCFTKEILTQYANPPLTEEEISLYSDTVSRFLLQLP